MESPSLYDYLLWSIPISTHGQLGVNVTSNDIQDVCKPFLDDTDENRDADITRAIFVGLFILSVSGLIFIATTIMFNKKLQTHP